LLLARLAALSPAGGSLGDAALYAAPVNSHFAFAAGVRPSIELHGSAYRVVGSTRPGGGTSKLQP
jgi:hypothetical protein